MCVMIIITIVAYCHYHFRARGSYHMARGIRIGTWAKPNICHRSQWDSVAFTLRNAS